MKTHVDIHSHRDGTITTDRAILDLLQLEQLGLAPGSAPVPLLEQIWNITQPQVSRRIAAVADLGIYRVKTNNRGRYLLLANDYYGPQRWVTVTKPTPIKIDDSKPSARERWEAIRQRHHSSC